MIASNNLIETERPDSLYKGGGRVVRKNSEQPVKPKVADTAKATKTEHK